MSTPTFADRARALVERLQASPDHVVLDLEITPPIAQDTIDQLTAQIGFSLDEAFLDCFRSCNGLRLAWVSRSALGSASERGAQLAAFDHAARSDHDLGTEHAGSLMIPPLEVLLDPTHALDTFGASSAVPGEHREEILGGTDAAELRRTLRWLDREFLRDEGDFYQTALVLDPRFPDPPVIFTNDHAASLSDGHPMLARDYLELMLACGAGMSNRRRFYRFEGAAGDHAMTSLELWRLQDHGYLEPGHAQALREVATRAGLVVREISAELASMEADQARYREVFDAFGVPYQARGLSGPGGYVSFEIPGSVEALIALEHALHDLGSRMELSHISAGYRSDPDAGYAFSVGNLSIELQRPEQIDSADPVLLYRPSDLPRAWSERLPPDHPAHDCLFFFACSSSPTISAIFELAEPPMDDIDSAMRLQDAVASRSVLSRTLAHEITPRDARVGFHTAPAAQIEAILEGLTFRRLSASVVFDGLELYEVIDASGAPVAGELRRTCTGSGRSPLHSVLNEVWPGLYTFTRLPPVYDTLEFSQGDMSAELAAADRPPPGQVHRLVLRSSA